MMWLLPLFLFGAVSLAAADAIVRSRPPREPSPEAEPVLTPEQRRDQAFQRNGLGVTLAVTLARHGEKRLDHDVAVRDAAAAELEARREADERADAVPHKPPWKTALFVVPVTVIWAVAAVTAIVLESSLLSASGVEQPRATLMAIALVVGVGLIGFMLVEGVRSGEIPLVPPTLTRTAMIVLGGLFVGIVTMIFINASHRAELQHGTQLIAADEACTLLTNDQDATPADTATACGLATELRNRIQVQQLWETGGLLGLLLVEMLASAVLPTALLLAAAARTKARHITAKKALRAAEDARARWVVSLRNTVLDELPEDVGPEDLLAVAAAPDSDLVPSAPFEDDNAAPDEPECVLPLPPVPPPPGEPQPEASPDDEGGRPPPDTPAGSAPGPGSPAEPTPETTVAPEAGGAHPAAEPSPIYPGDDDDLYPV